MTVVLLEYQSSLTSPACAYKPLIWKFASTDASIVRMKFDVYVTNEDYPSANLASTIYHDFDIDSTTFTFDLSDVAKDNLGFKLIDIDSSTSNYEDRVGAIWMHGGITEIIESSSGLLEEGTTTALGKVDVYNITGTVGQIVSYTRDENFCNYANMKKFLTSYPTGVVSDSPAQPPTRLKEIGLDENEFLGFGITPTIGALDTMKIEIYGYNAAGSLIINSVLKTWNASTLGAFDGYSNNYFTFPVGTANLEAAGIDTSQLYRYYILISNQTAGLGASEFFGYKVVDRCEESTRIHWQNRFGKTDSYTFEGRKIYSRDSKSEIAIRPLRNGFTTKDVGSFSFNTNTEEVYEIWTKAIGRDELQWLSEININNRAFIEIDKEYYSIIIEDSSYSLIDSEEVVYQFKLNFRIANSIKGLRG